MKKMLLALLLVPVLSMADVKVNFTLQVDQEKFSGECVVAEGEDLAYKHENGIEIVGDVLVDGPHVLFDLEITKDNELISGPCFATFLGTTAGMKIEDLDQNKVLIELSIIATPFDDHATEDHSGEDRDQADAA